MNNKYKEINYSKQFQKKLNKKEVILHTISVELKKNPNTIYNNYSNSTTNQIKIINLTNNNNNQIVPTKSKIFKNIKLYGVSKNVNFIKKRNIKTKKLNNIPYVSFTEINTGFKKTYSNFNTNNNITNNNVTNFNNTYNIYHKNYQTNNSNNAKNLSKINKSLPKSKSNQFFLTPLYNANVYSRNKDMNNIIMKSNSNSNSCNTKTYNNSNNKKGANTKHSKYHINFSPKYANHSISVSKQKNIKLSEYKKRGLSSGGVPEDKIKIQKLEKERETKEKEIKYKDQIIKEQENIIKLLKQNEGQLKDQINVMNKKYAEMKDSYANILNENELLNNKLLESENNVNFLKEKELKLMRMLYLIKEKGIDINTILNESNNDSFNKRELSENNEPNTSSNLTVYFPDKINMKNIMELKEVEKVPKIDFNQIPEYSFQSDEEKHNNNYDENPYQDEFNLNLSEDNNFGFHGFHRNSI